MRHVLPSKVNADSVRLHSDVLVIWVPGGSSRPYKVPDDVNSKKNRAVNYRIYETSGV